MIPILYDNNETDFTHHGIGTLTDCTSCIVTEERNGAFECELEYPMNGIHYMELSLDRIIKAKPNDIADDQLFRIYRLSKPMNGLVKVYCQHISYDLNTNIVTPFSTKNSSATNILQMLLSHCCKPSGFTATSTVGGTRNFSVETPTAARSLLGGTEGSVLDLFHGEYEFNNKQITLHAQRGNDTGVTILYGKNLTDITAESSIENTYTAIFPYAVDNDEGGVYTLPEKIISTGQESAYGEPRILAVDFSDGFDLSEEDITIQKLRQLATAFVSDNHITDIYQNIEVSFVGLWQTEQYKNVAMLERVNLCDTVTVKYDKLGVSVSAKVIKTIYDTIKEKYKKIEIGEARSNLADTLVKASKDIEKVQDTIVEKSDLAIAIERATALITGQDGGNVVIHTNETTGQPYEILIMDTDDINTAKKVWRWNLAGLGYSNTGYSGSYGLAMTMDGAINASFITTGEMSANRITAGQLTDKAGKNYWNLNNGNFRLSQNNALNSLTHDGDAPGIYLTPVEGEDYSELRINANYIKSGTINADLITTGSMAANRITSGQLTDKAGKNYWNLNNGEFRLSATAKVGSTSSSPTLTNYITSTADTNLMTQTKIFNTLTNNGKLQGIYMYNNQLYINGTYIRSGTINADLITTGNLNANLIKTGAINADLITTGTLSANRISTGVLSSTNSRTTFNLNNGKITIKSTDGQTSAINGAISLDNNGLQLFDSNENLLAFLNITKMFDPSGSSYNAGTIYANMGIFDQIQIKDPIKYLTIDSTGYLKYNNHIIQTLTINIGGTTYHLMGYRDE